MLARSVFIRDFLKAFETTTAMKRREISCTFCSDCAVSNLSLHGRCVWRSLQDPARVVISLLLAHNCCSLAVVVRSIFASQWWARGEVVISRSFTLWDLYGLKWGTQKFRGCYSFMCCLEVPHFNVTSKILAKNVPKLSPKCLSRSFIEFLRGRPRVGNNFTSLYKSSRPFIQSVKSTLSYLKSCHPARGTPWSTARFFWVFEKNPQNSRQISRKISLREIKQIRWWASAGAGENISLPKKFSEKRMMRWRVWDTLWEQLCVCSTKVLS